MNYDDLEQELVNVINGYLAANLLTTDPEVLLNTVFQARQMPENQDELLQDYDKGLVNVHYSDSEYLEPDSTDLIRQLEIIRITCFLQCNAVKGKDGGFALLGHVKAALVGYTATNAKTRMWISGYGDWRIEEGQLNPFIEFSLTTMVVQGIEEPDIYPIDKMDSVVTGGGLEEIDSELYDLARPDEQIGEDNEKLN